MTEFAIQTDKLTCDFGKGQGIFHLDLQIKPGTVTGLIGRNGAGKTTLLRILVGLQYPGSGSASVLGLDCLQDREQILSRVGFVDERRALYDWMKVDEILEFTGSFYSTWDGKVADEMIREFRLHRDQQISTLSRGQRAELALILAMAHHPELLILDEPTSGLDIVVRHEFLEKFIHFACNDGASILFSTHILDDVERIADRVAFIDEGRLLHEGDQAELKSRYAAERRGSETTGPVSLKDIFLDTLQGKFTLSSREGEL